MSDIVHRLKNDISWINDFTNDFFKKTSTLDKNVTEALAKLNGIIAIEKNNNEFLTTLESGISDTELDRLEDNIQKQQQLITEKQKEYLNLIEKNSQNILKMKKMLEDRKSRIASIYEAIDNLESSMALITSMD